MVLKELKDKIETLESTFWESYGELVNTYQDQYVNPFLKANNLKLDTGMGSCTVETLDDSIRFYDKMDKTTHKAVTEKEYDELYSQAEAIKALPGWEDLWMSYNLLHLLKTLVCVWEPL